MAEDIGRFVPPIFANSARFGDQTLEIVSDAVTGSGSGWAYSMAAGQPITYARFSDAVTATNSFVGGLTALLDDEDGLQTLTYIAAGLEPAPAQGSRPYLTATVLRLTPAHHPVSRAKGFEGECVPRLTVSLASCPSNVWTGAHDMATREIETLCIARALRAERTAMQRRSGADPDIRLFGEAAREIVRRFGGGLERVILTLFASDGRSALTDVGRFRASTVTSGLPSLDGAGSEMACTVTFMAGTGPEIVVEAFQDGLAHGFTACSPSKVEMAGRTVTVCSHIRGHDVSCLFDRPVQSLSDSRGGDRPERGAFLPTHDHASLLRVARLAEARGEAVVLHSKVFGEARLVRSPGEKSYALQSAHWTNAAIQKWSAVRQPVLSVVSAPDGVLCRRQVGGAIDGATQDRPGMLLSRTAAGREVLDVRYFRQGERLAAPEPTVADEIAHSWGRTS